jgi:hypothetical protein
MSRELAAPPEFIVNYPLRQETSRHLDCRVSQRFLLFVGEPSLVTMLPFRHPRATAAAVIRRGLASRRLGALDD